jgi:hypothetical protein
MGESAEPRLGIQEDRRRRTSRRAQAAGSSRRRSERQEEEAMILRTLSAVEVRWAAAALGAFFPEAHRGALPVGVASLDVAGTLRELFGRVPIEPVLGLRLAIWIVGLAPFVVLGRFRTIASLSEDDRERVVGALIESRIYAVRQLLVALKAIGALLYCASPRVRNAMLRPQAVPSLVRVRAPAKSSAVASMTPVAEGVAHEPLR